MPIRRSFVAALLMAAASASGQTAAIQRRAEAALPRDIARSSLRYVTLSPAAATLAPSAALNGASPVLATPLSALAPAVRPLGSAAQPLGSAAAVAVSPVASPIAARVATISGALQDFSRMDLNSAASAEARDQADVLMLRALGDDLGLGGEEETVASAEASAPRPRLAHAPPSAPRLYLLSRPLREHVELGPVARTVHVSYKVLAQVFKVWLAWTLLPTTEVVIGALIYQGYRLPATLAEFTAQTAIDLSLRYWWRKLKVLKELARQPGVSRLRVLTWSRVRFSGLIARSADKEGLVFVESDLNLPESVGRLGAPIPIEDMSGRRARLILADGRGFSPITWTPTVSELLDGRPIPAGIARAWRAHLEESELGRSRLARFLDFSKDRQLRLEARLAGAAGEETRLGAIASGSAVRAFIGLGRLNRLLGRRPAPRAIALTDSRVEKPGAQREASLRAALARAWRRLTGRLIVL